MTTNYDWYTTNYQHAAVYMQYLLPKQMFITNPSPSVDLKKSVDFISLKFLGQFHIFRDTRTKYQNPGLSPTIQDVWHVPDNPGRMACMSYFVFIEL